MGIFLVPVPPKPLKADERLCRLRQGGRPLERYVEEFLEVSNLVSWTDACINVVFLMGLDKDVIRYNEPACNFSLVDSLNSILLLNGSNFEVDEIQKNQSPCPAPSATYRASPAHLTPEPCTYRFNGPAYAWPPVATKPSAPAAAEPSGPAYSWPPVAAKPSAPAAAAEPSGPAYSRPPVAAEPSAPAAAEPYGPAYSSPPALSEPAAPALSEPVAPVSTEPVPVPVGILIVFEGMDWTSLPASPVSAAEPASPVCHEPAPALSEPFQARHKPAPALSEPFQAHGSTPLRGLTKTSLNLPKYFLGGGQVPVGGVHVGATHVGGLPTPPWQPTSPDPPWPAKAPDPPWLMDPPWRPPLQPTPLPAPA
ncbi:hypothetical protein DPX16_17878 [Anabarilius grahami]|uniref:Retrotransposon gag domain-containing protein n=1 Tax=Anabarilius grahami TaxID=495550 RepID=A0A3N0YGJ0_ANAGA|nr:hypothetical protein DPX16_17878 [Anabarilius grahami]